MHRVLKDIIGSGRGGFNRVIVRIHNAIVSQIDEIRASMNMSLSKRPTVFDDPRMPSQVCKVLYKLNKYFFDKCLTIHGCLRRYA